MECAPDTAGRAPGPASLAVAASWVADPIALWAGRGRCCRARPAHCATPRFKTHLPCRSSPLAITGRGRDGAGGQSICRCARDLGGVRARARRRPLAVCRGRGSRTLQAQGSNQVGGRALDRDGDYDRNVRTSRRAPASLPSSIAAWSRRSSSAVSVDSVSFARSNHAWSSHQRAPCARATSVA